MTKTEAAEIIAREVVDFMVRTGRTDGRTVAQETVAEWYAGHEGTYRQDVAWTNGYGGKDIARVIKAAKARVADLQAAARDRETARRLGS